MALLLLRRSSSLSIPQPQWMSFLFKLRLSTKPQSPPDATTELSSNCPSASNHPSLWKSLLLPFPGRNTAEGFSIEIVDEDRWGVSSGLANIREGMAESLIRSDEPCSSGEEGTIDERWCPEFDAIEDMRLRKKLFYKLERDSKEYEECRFSLYRKKSDSKGKERRKDLALKEKCVSQVNANQKLAPRNTGRNNLGGSFDEGKVYGSRKKEMHAIPACVNGVNRENVKVFDSNSRLVEGKRKGSLKAFNCKAAIQDSYDSEHENHNAEFQFANDVDNELPCSDSILRDSSVPQIPSDPWDAGFAVGSEEQLLVDGKKKRAPTYNQLTDPYHLPFCLDIYITKGSVRACIVHRVTSKVVVVAHSISKDLKFDLKSRKDASACAAVGGTLAQRALADDIHNVVYTPRKGDKIEGKLQTVLESIIKGGIDVNVKLKKRKTYKVYTQRKTC